MSAANAIEIDERLRAALLWDEPWLSSGDTGARQWIRTLRLEFAHADPLDPGDPISLAAHLAQAAMVGNETSVASLRPALQAGGDGGNLFALLLALWLELELPGEPLLALEETHAVIERVDDLDLRARLLLRLASFSLQRRHPERARQALISAISITDMTTRLGVVVRRHAAGQGIELSGFNPYASTDTPDDPLLTLPWVRALALDAAAALSSERLEHSLRGVWDSSFHIGRTKLDDLLAAHAQAEWCGALDLRGEVARLASSHVLLSAADESPRQTRWALLTWATSPQAKGVPAAVRAAEDRLDAGSAAELLVDVQDEGLADARVYVDVAAGLWDLLDDDGARGLVNTLVGVLPNPTIPQLSSLIGTLLWRVPSAWTTAFAEAGAVARGAMVESLGPHHVDVMPPALRMDVAQVRRQANAPNGLDVALALATESGVDQWPALAAPDLLELLSWRANSVPTSKLEATVASVVEETKAAIRSAHEGSWALDDASTRLLGELAAALSSPPRAAFETLLYLLEDDQAAASWQFGALEALAMLRDADGLDTQDVDRVRRLSLTPGRMLLGEQISASLLRAAQLRVCAPTLQAEEVAWLATRARDTDAKTRLVAIAALGDLCEDPTPTVEWSLVSGLFDPSDDVVVRAVGAFAHLSASSPDAVAVARSRLNELYHTGGSRVRRRVVAVVKAQDWLNFGDLLADAREDRSWTVRREAALEPAH